MIFFVILILLMICIPYFYMEDRFERLYFKIAMCAMNAVLLFLAIFSFQIFRALTFLAAILYLLLAVPIILANLVLVIGSCIKHKAIKELLFLLPLAFSLLFSFISLKFNLSERLALKLEFDSYKAELDDYIFNNNKTENIRTFSDYGGIIWDGGFLDKYSAIIYDENNNLDLLFKSGDKKIEESFGRSLVDVMKIQDNYFRCNFHD